jgi:hypothetical protein
MWGVIAGVIQIISLLLKNKFEKDEELKKKKEAMGVEAKEAIKSRDASRINDILIRLRQ